MNYSILNSRETVYFSNVLLIFLLHIGIESTQIHQKNVDSTGNGGTPRVLYSATTRTTLPKKVHYRFYIKR